MYPHKRKNRFLMVFFIIVPLILGEWHVTMAQSANKGRLVIALIDQTDSFGANAVKGVAKTFYWDEALQKIRMVVNTLRARDEFVLIAINDRGFVDENFLINLQQFDRAGLKARMQTRILGDEIIALKRPEKKFRRTDILSALFQAAYVANREKMSKTIIICFSDMIQEPDFPTAEDAQELSFPANTQGCFYFVDASGRERWNQVLQAWTPILRQANMHIGDPKTPNFFQSGETDRALQRMLREW